jgi:predicted aldo/keto reductase-like oxidoreductase
MMPAMKNTTTRREFIRDAGLLAGAALTAPLLASAAEKKVKQTAADRVVLGKTGLELSRLGMGAGSNSGNVQRSLGREGFNRLVRHAYDRGITFIDTAQGYQTHDWVREAIKGLPRERYFLQTKMSGAPEKALDVIDRYRKELDTDYIDSLLVHCMVKGDWTDQMKRIMEAFDVAKEKKWIRTKGVSCHSLPALTAAAASDWTNVHLVRLNPQGAHLDTPAETWNAKSSESDIPPVVAQIKAMRAKGHGIIGMKLIGDGDFKQPEQRERSIRYVMQSNLCDAVVIGFKSPAEIDEAIERIDRALAEAA